MDTPQKDGDTISLMDSVLASQVAAGEVVERPASVIKELVENAIDAGAQTIRVKVSRGGIHFMRVSDDGCGMSRRDTQMCLVRHATSKLRGFDDLFNIQQMGFRGEAIPSIASVSQFTITSRRENDVEGTRLYVEGGVAEDPQAAGCPRGTTIEVRELFYNTPARRKFLKSAETEVAHIEHQLMLHALCYPGIRFVFESDTSRMFDVAASNDLRMRIADFYGTDLAAELIKMSSGEAPGVTVQGYLLPLSEARRNRKMQFIFLNGRPIEDKILLRAVRDGYGGLPTGLHPVLFLYLQVDPALVDINVHPAKKEVRFRRQGDVCTAVIDSIAASLSQHAKQLNKPDSSMSPSDGAAFISYEPVDDLSAVCALLAPVALSSALHPVEPSDEQIELPMTFPAELEERLASTSFVELPQPNGPGEYINLVSKRLESVPHFRYIGAVQESYAVFENKEGMVLLCPRAARERLIFERLMKSNSCAYNSQRLLIPVLLELDARDLAAAQELKPQFERSGFGTSLFGRNTLRVDSIPAMLPISQVEEFMLHLLELFGSGGEFRLSRARDPYQLFVQHLAKQYAQQEDKAVLLENAMMLLSDLLSCEIPYCTPSGKPTMFPFSLNEMKRKFNAN